MSLNTVAVRLAMEVSPKTVIATARSSASGRGGGSG
jgi:membrane peptidoglycan carboxypeptidase